ncbi:MAG: diaminopimelate epimerase [Butyrivibrio sp.]|nr:diaminopimelate epimerase [Butyrivibrio sp.]
MFFTKVNGLGNDFIIVEENEENISNLKKCASKVCNRYTGIGADGILVLSKSTVADLKMTIINSDGSIAEMCGNGIRCVAKYAYENKIVNKEEFEIETLAGIMKPQLFIENGKVRDVTINMGSPFFDSNKLIAKKSIKSLVDIPVIIGNKKYLCNSVLMGVPHTVVFVDNIDDIDVCELGSIIEKNSIFLNGTNVNFVQVIDEDTLIVRTWERGAGYTKACGTGACSSAVIFNKIKSRHNKICTKLQLGELYVEWTEEGVLMTGPAETVFKGEMEV